MRSSNKDVPIWVNQLCGLISYIAEGGQKSLAEDLIPRNFKKDGE